jgi:hypothetical protein
MTFSIPLSHILDKLTDLLPLTYDQLSEMTSKQLRDNVAKILGVPKAYQLKKLELSKTYRKQVGVKNRGKLPLEIAGLVGACKKTLDQLKNSEQPHWTKVSVAVALGTGRRMAEIHSLGSFEVIGEYKLHFSGQAKTREAEQAKTDYDIPTLFPATALKLAIDYLDQQGRRLDPDIQKADRNAVNAAYAMALSREMSKYSGINYKGLRAIYAECQWALLSEPERHRTEKHIKYSDWLGHIDKEGASDATFMSYMVYQVADIDKVKREFRQ